MKLNAIRIPNIRQRTPEWFELRKGQISGSTLASVLSRNPYQSADNLMQDMLDDLRGVVTEKIVSADMQRGVDWEDGILRAGLEKEFGAEIASTVEDTDAFWLDEQANICFSPDGLIEVEGRRWLVEVKAPRRLDTRSEVPSKHMDQLSLGMEMLNCSGAIYIQGQVQGEQLQQVRCSRIGKSPHWWGRVSPQVEAFQKRLQQLRQAEV